MFLYLEKVTSLGYLNVLKTSTLLFFHKIVVMSYFSTKFYNDICFDHMHSYYQLIDHKINQIKR